MPHDTLLDVLSGCGTVDTGWWDLLATTNRADAWGVRLFLPRPGDQRGVGPLNPDAFDSGAIIALEDVQGVHCWLLPRSDGPWTVTRVQSPRLPPPDVAATDRHLRTAILAAANDLESIGDVPLTASARQDHERVVAAWSRVRLPPERAALAARAVPLFVTLTDAPAAGHTAHAQERRRATLAGLDSALRGAIEAAYSTAVPAAP